MSGEAFVPPQSQGTRTHFSRKLLNGTSADLHPPSQNLIIVENRELAHTPCVDNIPEHAYSELSSIPLTPYGNLSRITGVGGTFIFYGVAVMGLSLRLLVS